jgi:hypothetical protein
MLRPQSKISGVATRSGVRSHRHQTVVTVGAQAVVTVSKPCHVGLETGGTVRTISGIAGVAILERVAGG